MKAKGRKLLTALLSLALLLTVTAVTAPVATATSNYYIEVDISNQIVTVYENSNRTESGIVAMMICSTGASGKSTPIGTFTMPKPWYSTERKQWYYFSPGTWGQYASRITGHILFHSYLYSSKGSAPIKSTVAALGSPASHGCVRLRPEDAKWIAENALPGTKVRIYRSGKVNESLRAALISTTWYRSSGAVQPPVRDYLTVGDTGDKVTALQQDLITLKLYSGSASGTYDQATADAVKSFQVYSHLTANGEANPATIAAIASRAAEIAARFGDAEYRPVFSGSTQNMAKVKVSGTIKVYKSTSTASAVIGRFKQGTAGIVLKKGPNWTLLQTDSLTGYCQNTKLTHYIDSTETLDYELVSAPETTPAPEATETPSTTPTPTPAPRLEASNLTLSTGSQGDAVRNLQFGLTALRLYSGAPSGNFDAATAEALRLFQASAGFAADGVATPAVQKALFDKAAALTQQYPEGNYRAVVRSTTVESATVTTRGSALNVRAKGNTSSSILGKLKNGAKVLVTQKGATWSVIQSGDLTGYCKNSYLKFSTDTNTEISYEIDPDAVASVQVTEPAALAAAEAAPSETIEAEAIAPAEEAPLYAVVAREDVKIYREAKEDEDAVLATPERDSFYLVIERGEVWTKIELEPQRIGYVRTEAVEFTTVKPEVSIEVPAESETSSASTETPVEVTEENPTEADVTVEATEAAEPPVENSVDTSETDTSEGDTSDAKVPDEE